MVSMVITGTSISIVIKILTTYYIHIEGRVQGVGFRPFVYRLAHELDIRGWVRNEGDGVHIQAQGREAVLQTFLSRISSEAPPIARITRKNVRQGDEEPAEKFYIRAGSIRHGRGLLLAPDLAICNDCRQEISDPGNKRYGYAFTTCTQCGPRYSIIDCLPYERENTSMKSFHMCLSCKEEYGLPEGKRHHSQTNSCPACRVQMELYGEQKSHLTYKQEEIIAQAANLLRSGKIVAVKGMGGYLLLCDAGNAETVHRLRGRKKRPSKPLAVMYPNLEAAEQDTRISAEARRLLTGPECPVVVVPVKDKSSCALPYEFIAPGLDSLGVLLPYTPLFGLLLSLFSSPVVATSANVSGEAIIFRDEEALGLVPSIADFVLVHNRAIRHPSDDSVVLFSEKHEQKIMLRRSRGFAPAFDNEAGLTDIKISALALGADLKSTFAFTDGDSVYVSQYFGNLECWENQKNMEHTLEQFTGMFALAPSVILTDKHPEYHSVQTGQRLARKFSAGIVDIQHHEAHFAAVLLENNLLKTTDPVAGIIWDGTGYGDEAMIRGCEFLLYTQGCISPFLQMEPFPNLFGNKMALEPRLSALSVCRGSQNAEALLKQKFTDKEWKVYRKTLSEPADVMSVSMGRVFDAIASLTGLCDRMTYEGEGAMLLEAAAKRERDLFDLPHYEIPALDQKPFPVTRIIGQIIDDILKGATTGHIAARFHVTLAALIERAARHANVRKVAFSGGVFQNGLLADLIIDKLGKDFELYFHRSLPPNDECISLGQLARIQQFHVKYSRSSYVPGKLSDHRNSATANLNPGSETVNLKS